MLYKTLRATAAIALRWYYADIVVQGLERVPRDCALLLIANHPNALIDPLLVGTTVQRRILLTAKATLFESPLLAALLRVVGVVPLRRAKDEVPADPDGILAPGVDRNREAFQLVTRALLHRRAILVFPEGISHDDSSMAPLKTGAARMALQAHNDGVTGVKILPVGLIYEEKERPGSRVLVRMGVPLDVDDWVSTSSTDVAVLTSELDSRLRAVTLNFATSDRAVRALELARSLIAISSTPATVGSPVSLDAEADVARRIDAATTRLAGASPAVTARADAFTTRLRLIEQELKGRGVSLTDVRISQHVRSGLWFTVRETVWGVISAITAVLGGWTHWIPLTLARRFALGSLRADGSRDQPAMRTILLGVAFVMAWYVLLAALLVRWHGWAWAAIGLVTLFAAAHVHRLLHGRFSRAVGRARSYLALRADPSLQRLCLTELDELLAEALALEQALEAEGGVIGKG